MKNQKYMEKLMGSGVQIIDPENTWIEDTVTIEPDTVIHPTVFIRGETKIGAGSVINPGSVITDSTLGERVEIRPYCVITDSSIADDAAVGPFAHLRPGTDIREAARIGNFVETKKAVIGEGSKVSHLTYVGDAELGEGVNIGAGCVTCNYDGFNKYRTVIEDGVFVGSGTMMVAPVTLGKGSLVAAGSTLTKDVPPGALAIARSQQIARKGWAAARREKLAGRDKKEKRLMCGIVGYIGPKNATDILLEGLRRLEYRGYDSAGIAVISDGDLDVRRSVGKIINLDEAIREAPLSGSTGVGHTRWATHGKPSEENAHPHRDCTGKLVVVHNGIIENYRDLRQKLISSGHTMASETDTEVIVHLVESHFTGDLEKAVRDTIRELSGVYAMVVMHADRTRHTCRRAQRSTPGCRSW